MKRRVPAVFLRYTEWRTGAQPRPEKGGMDMETARYTILIVEDDDTIARLVSDRLSRWGMETVVVEDFSAVLDLSLIHI